MLADQIRAAAMAAPRMKLPDVAAVLWRAYGAGQVSEAEAEELSALIESRKALPAASEAPRKPVGSRPRSDASLERRRRWAASGRLPPQLAARFTLAEAAVLAVVASEVARRGDCRLTIEHIAALAGVSRSTVKNAVRQARLLGLVTVEERQQTAWRNLSNVIRIVSPEWQAWNRLARCSSFPGGGVKSVTTPTTDKASPVNFGQRNPRRAAEGQGRSRVCAT
ncbi:transcriptional regulator [Methylobacterium oryzisoli]|uniref:transcriptional regulator n=1 Tax=Methylobacterium oryzisoli TaxID=3385502 RepID=UPI003891DF32